MLLLFLNWLFTKYLWYLFGLFQVLVLKRICRFEFDTYIFMKQVTIKRPIESFNKNCSYAIIISGNKIAEINNGETKVIEVNDDSDEVQAKIYWCGSNKMSMDQGQNSVEITGNKFFNKWLPFSGSLLIILGLAFTINHEIAWLKTLGIVLMILYLFFLIGTLTI